uniref:Uncharacterized protein n=1 Tax=Arundo donax TaxID=35708 RepID=A0A0A9CAC6_ARUDO
MCNVLGIRLYSGFIGVASTNESKMVHRTCDQTSNPD